jgi:hypothetical protein
VSEFIVVLPRIEGNPEMGYDHVYYSDLKRLPSVEQAVSHGCLELAQSDDFLIGKVDGPKLVSLQWMDEVRDDRHELIDAAKQLCLEVAGA